jgi:hypothetical protein
MNYLLSAPKPPLNQKKNSPPRKGDDEDAGNNFWMILKV